MSKNSISFGSDPEFMLTDEKGNLHSAIGVVPGTKEDRYDLGGGHRGYYDNVLAEVEIRPSFSAEEAVENFRDCFQRYADLVHPYKLTVRASATYPAKECQHEDAEKFGCDPEYDAFDVVQVEPPACMKGNYFRSGGGHVHIGYNGGADDPNAPEDIQYQIMFNRLWVIRMCDIFLGIPSVVMDRDPTSVARRKLYGGAGSHRLCPNYGVEYRTLSNFWLARPDSVRLIYRLAELAVARVYEHGDHEELWGEIVGSATLRKTINAGNQEAAWKILKDIRAAFPDDIYSEIENLSKLPHPQDFYGEWGITVDRILKKSA